MVISIVVAIVFTLAISQEWLNVRKNTTLSPFVASQTSKSAIKSPNNCVSWQQICDQGIDFYQIDNQGKINSSGSNLAIVFDPKSSKLDFKVNLPIDGKIGQIDSQGKLLKAFIPKKFPELINDENSLLDGNKPIAGINADYVDKNNLPQGLNISRGVEYLGYFSGLRSSFAIGNKNRQSSITIGSRSISDQNYNVVGGNGRFYTNGDFTDICQNLGQYACSQSTNRSMTVITDKQLVIFLVHKSTNQEILLPADFKTLLENFSTNLDLGKPFDGMLFDGGDSPSIFFKDTIVPGEGNLGSVFLIYQK